MLDARHNLRALELLARLQHSAAIDDAEEPAGRLLLATAACEPPVRTLQFARELAKILGAELHLLAGKRSDDDGRDFIAFAAEYARDLSASLLIVPDREQQGVSVAKLVQASMLPVLVARQRTGTGCVLAASDLSTPRVPVIRQAAALGHLLHSTVVAMHNCAPASVELRQNVARITRWNPEPGDATRKLQALVDATCALRVPRAVLTCNIDPVYAILNEARVRRCTAIVLGTRVTGGPTRRRTIAADIVDLAHDSVLVVPVSLESQRAALSTGEASAPDSAPA